MRRRFLESLLILFGIALGVGVLTGMESFLRFLVAMENDSLLGQPNLRSVVVSPKTFDLAELYGGGGQPAVRLAGGRTDPVTLTVDDLLAARSEVSGIAYVTTGQSGAFGTPIVAVDGRPWQPADAPGQSVPTLVVERITPDDLRFQGREMLAGRELTWEEYEEGSPVLIIDEGSVDLLLPGRTPQEAVGHTVTGNRFMGFGEPQGVEWRIIGVVGRPRGPRMMVTSSSGAAVRGYAAHTAGEADFVSLRDMAFAPEHEGDIDRLVNDLEVYFTNRLGPDRVTVSNPVENLREIAGARRRVSLTLMGLAGLALLVASVNILNLFTARVIRRRRLTAMSIALGAERRSLFGRVLTEALLLGLGGSLLGMLPAYGIILLLRGMLTIDASVPAANDTLFSGLALSLPDAMFGIAVGVGASLLFGLYPAFLSASIEPAEGLKAE